MSTTIIFSYIVQPRLVKYVDHPLLLKKAFTQFFISLHIMVTKRLKKYKMKGSHIFCGALIFAIFPYRRIVMASSKTRTVFLNQEEIDVCDSVN